jgi:DNA-binding MurR/RpiR family transcriptional regulator
MRIVERLAAAAGSLTPSEELAAKLLEKDPPRFAFGSLAEVAQAAGTSGPTVVRLASKLGFSGFADMKDAIQEELSLRLAPASERVGAQASVDLSQRVGAADTENVVRSLEAVAPSLSRVVAMLSDEERRVHVLPSAACRAVGVVLADQLSQLRDGVTLHYGPPTEVARELAGTQSGDIVLVMDTRRYEKWVVEAAGQARAAGASVIAVTDTPLSPLVAGSESQLIVRAVGAGPFDSLTGALSVVNALCAGVAAKVHLGAGKRLRRAEEALVNAGALVDPTPGSETGLPQTEPLETEPLQDEDIRA